MLKMTSKSEQPGRVIDLHGWNNEGASGALKRDPDRSRLYGAVDFRVRQRRQQLAGSVADRPVNVSHDGGENGLAQCKSAQAAQHPRREHRAAVVSHDLWRFSCEMPDAPHLRDDSTPP
jgi:hypothetical protein